MADIDLGGLVPEAVQEHCHIIGGVVIQNGGVTCLAGTIKQPFSDHVAGIGAAVLLGIDIGFVGLGQSLQLLPGTVIGQHLIGGLLGLLQSSSGLLLSRLHRIALGIGGARSGAGNGH